MRRGKEESMFHQLHAYRKLAARALQVTRRARSTLLAVLVLLGLGLLIGVSGVPSAGFSVASAKASVLFSDHFTDGLSSDWTVYNRYSRVADGRLWIDQNYLP